jgi:hypothetical protein
MMRFTVLVLVATTILLAMHTRVAHAEQCVAGGVSIQSVPSAAIPDVAMATMYNGQPVILVNPTVAPFLSPLFAKWVYWHECAHHVLGHVAAGAVGFRRPYVDEQEADCWSIRKLVADGLSSAGVDAIQAEAARALGQAGDNTHLPAIVRAMNIRECLRVASGGGGDRACATRYVPRQVVRYRTVLQTQTVPCSHMACYPYYGCRPVHPGHTVTVPVQVPYTETEMTAQRSCGEASSVGTDDDTVHDTAERSHGSWQYEYKRIGSDSWLKSIKFSSEESCTRSHDRKDRLDDYIVQDCEEVD